MEGTKTTGLLNFQFISFIDICDIRGICDIHGICSICGICDIMDRLIKKLYLFSIIEVEAPSMITSSSLRGDAPYGNAEPSKLTTRDSKMLSKYKKFNNIFIVSDA